MNSRYDYVKCSLPNCDKGVGYHRTQNRSFFEGISIRWKTVCEKHPDTYKKTCPSCREAANG